MWAKQQQKGFTIVELLIVILVIGILAAIIVVAYNGIQTRANDGQIKSAAYNVKSALTNYVAVNGTKPSGGWGSTQALTNGDCINGNGGFISKGIYTCDVEEVLVAKNLIPATLLSNLTPNKKFNNSASYNFMLYDCTATSIILLWYLEMPSASDTASYDSSISQCTGMQDFRGSFGMQAAAIISF